METAKQYEAHTKALLTVKYSFNYCNISQIFVEFLLELSLAKVVLIRVYIKKIITSKVKAEK